MLAYFSVKKTMSRLYSVIVTKVDVLTNLKKLDPQKGVRPDKINPNILLSPYVRRRASRPIDKNVPRLYASEKNSPRYGRQPTLQEERQIFNKKL